MLFKDHILGFIATFYAEGAKFFFWKKNSNNFLSGAKRAVKLALLM